MTFTIRHFGCTIKKDADYGVAFAIAKHHAECNADVHAALHALQPGESLGLPNRMEIVANDAYSTDWSQS